MAILTRREPETYHHSSLDLRTNLILQPQGRLLNDLPVHNAPRHLEWPFDLPPIPIIYRLNRLIMINNILHFPAMVPQLIDRSYLACVAHTGIPGTHIHDGDFKPNARYCERQFLEVFKFMRVMVVSRHNSRRRLDGGDDQALWYQYGKLEIMTVSHESTAEVLQIGM